MKKGDKPKDLSQKWWSKNKAKTLKSTGLGKVLEGYEKVRAGKPSLKYYQDCLKELNKIPGAVDKAKKMCNKSLHAETLDALGGYSTVIKKEMTDLSKEETDYTKRLSIFKSSREKLVKELTAIHKKTEDACSLAGSGLEKLKAAVSKKDVGMAGKLNAAIQKACETAIKNVEDGIKTCAPWRTGQAPYSQPDLDVMDRDNAGGTKTLDTINPLMVQLNGFKSDAEKHLKAAKEEMSKLG